MSTPAARVTALCLHTAHYTHYTLGLHTGYNSWGVEGLRPSLTLDFKINGAGKVIKPIHRWLLIFCTGLVNVGQTKKTRTVGYLSLHTHTTVSGKEFSHEGLVLLFDVIPDILSLMSCFRHKYSSIW